MPYKDPEKQREARRKYNESRKGQRHAVWMGVFYEESAPGWRDELSEMMLPVCVSPLHDRDAWTKTDERKDPAHRAGELKKPHRHWVAEYPNPVDFETVCRDFEFLGSKNVKWVKDKCSMALYLCHLRDPEKAQYDKSEVLEFGAASWYEWCSSSIDVHEEMKAMRRFIRDNGITDFYAFWDWCDDNNDTWSRLLDTRCCYAIERYIKSLRASGA